MDQESLLKSEIEGLISDGDEEDDLIDYRTMNKSAPPRLTWGEQNEFLYQSRFASFFDDIRCDTSYDLFYQKNKNEMNLPAPIEGKLWGTNQEKNELKKVPLDVKSMDGDGGEKEENKETPVVANFHKKPKRHSMYANPYKAEDHPDLEGQVWQLARDQFGCRFLQNRLDEEKMDVRKQIFNGVRKKCSDLMSDPFGNYLCQKLIEKCDEVERLELLKACSDDLLSISTNIHGTRAIQKFIEYLTTPDQMVVLIKSLENHVVALIKDLYGNHVVQKILRVFNEKNKQFVYDAICKDCSAVATHKHGCCVIQRCFDYSSPKQKVQLIREIARHSLEFVTNPFGNYVIQYVLNLEVGEWNDVVISQFCGNIYRLSKNKFSSNVVEKSLKIACQETKDRIIEEILVMRNLSDLLRDPYGNYVIQTAISLSSQKQLKKFNQVVRPLLRLIINTKSKTS